MSVLPSAGTSVTAYVSKWPFWPIRTFPAARTFLTHSDSPRVDTTKSEPSWFTGTTGTRCGSTALRRSTSRVCTSPSVQRIASLLKILVTSTGGFKWAMTQSCPTGDHFVTSLVEGPDHFRIAAWNLSLIHISEPTRLG